MPRPKNRNTELDARFTDASRWPEEGEALRTILLECELREELKWGKPCYTHDGKNIAIIQRMKGFLALMFFKGALLKDPKGVLKKQGENSVSPRRLEFESVKEVTDHKATIQALVREAIQVTNAGMSVPKPKRAAYVAELAERLAQDPAFKSAFEALTPGRRREYNLHISSAKQSKTRAARVEKYAPKILAGKGFRDKGFRDK